MGGGGGGGGTSPARLGSARHGPAPHRDRGAGGPGRGGQGRTGPPLPPRSPGVCPGRAAAPAPASAGRDPPHPPRGASAPRLWPRGALLLSRPTLPSRRDPSSCPAPPGRAHCPPRPAPLPHAQVMLSPPHRDPVLSPHCQPQRWPLQQPTLPQPPCPEPPMLPTLPPRQPSAVPRNSLPRAAGAPSKVLGPCPSPVPPHGAPYAFRWAPVGSLGEPYLYVLCTAGLLGPLIANGLLAAIS